MERLSPATRRTVAALAALYVILAAAAGAAGGCAGRGEEDTPGEGGFFSGYEFGNEEDRADERRTRPPGSTYE